VASLDPALLSAIDDLELVARLIVEGAMTGPHRSPFHGYSAEFSQYRSYRHGDDLRHLDWKLFARTNRLYTKQFRETTNMSVVIVLDASASMAFPDPGVSKFRYAAMIAAALAHLITTQGDGVGLMTGRDEQLVYLPPKGGRAHLRSIVAELDRVEPGGAWHPDRVIGRAAQLLKRRGLLIVISDFYDVEDATLAEMKRVIRRGHEVAMLQVLSREEMTLPYRGAIEFEDLESGATRLLDVVGAERAYRDAVTMFLDRWRSEAHALGIDHVLFQTDTPPQDVLREYLLRRSNGHHRHAEPADVGE
jgi:uncharacterized protein (DUF58 family)